MIVLVLMIVVVGVRVRDAGCGCSCRSCCSGNRSSKTYYRFSNLYIIRLNCSSDVISCTTLIIFIFCSISKKSEYQIEGRKLIAFDDVIHCDKKTQEKIPSHFIDGRIILSRLLISVNVILKLMKIFLSTAIYSAYINLTDKII